jgi:hypothetical protein
MGLMNGAPPHGLCFKTSEPRVQNRYRATQVRAAFFGSWTRSINQLEAREKL